jgi:ADP-ribose pyrophosphatase YjhB (NUDIX family)
VKNYFQGTKESPYHISIGAVVRNAGGEICCHHFKTFIHPTLGIFEDFYILMRESIEPHETMEQCLARGLQEEFGMAATLESFLGSITSHFPIQDKKIEKTTLYFLCKSIPEVTLQRKVDDLESQSEIKWLKPAELISKMKEQSARLKREDIDESKIVERLLA